MGQSLEAIRNGYPRRYRAKDDGDGIQPEPEDSGFAGHRSESSK